ncbi:MAG TPA: hypothetical protein VFQ41_22685 [Candidatus Angelobacter sp.]|nr:hypothetical protein [Candidatus Angelobacter sp.]
MKSMNLFAQIAKIDESKHEVWGIATAEVVDKEGEIFDYQSSKPYFKSWSDEISKATDGKSLGNVREMHEPSAVGKLVAIAFDDDLKQIRIGACIVDSVAWQKCMLGVYTGFSIGGAYVKSWKDGEFVRFTANPVEISVVDNPCVPGAHFTAVKADGSCEVRKFSRKDAVSEQALKIGARHSKATRAHLDAIKACMAKMAQSHQEAETHMDALLEDDAAGNAGRSASAQMTKIPDGSRSGVKTGDQNMLESNDKAQLEKARASSASALAKLAEMEQEVAGLRSEMESNNQEIQRSLSNLLSLVEKLVSPQESVGRVARTGVPAHTITKEDDARPALAKSAGEPSVHELLKKTLQKPQPASVYLR